MSSDISVNVDGLSKKFSYSLKKSMFYGLADISREMLGLSLKSHKLRADEFWSLDDVSFTVKPGECLGIIGHNGAGKSTLLKILNGILIPDKGTVEIRGRVGALIEIGAGFHPLLTGRENIYVNGSVLGMTKKEIDSKFDSIVDFAELEEFIDTPVKFYSSGMYVRLGFAVAAHAEPDILLVDEILAVGDLAFQQKCLQNLKKRIAEGCTVLFVSHNVRIVQFICDRILLLDHGKVETCGEVAPVVERYLEILAENQIARSKTGPEVAFTTSKNPISVTSIGLLDGSGNPASIFKMGEKLLVELVVEAETPVEKPSLSITVWTEDKIRVSTLSTQYVGFETEEIRGKKKFQCRIDHLDLMPGTYHLRGGVYDAFAGAPYDQWGWEDRLISFKVVSGKSDKGSMVFYEGLGVTNMRYRWENMESSQ